jgi:hypothetical protein
MTTINNSIKIFLPEDRTQLLKYNFHGTIDEAPFTYRDSKLIMDSIEETVIIEKHLRTIMNVKG